MLNIDKKTGEIYCYGVVGNSMFADGFTDMEVIAALKEIGNKRAIVRINSPGGTADMGIAIYNALKRHKPGVDTHNDSLAASAASVIFLAGETRTASAGSRVMIHRAMTIELGNAESMRKMADTLEVYDKSLADIYADYMPEGVDIMSLMSAETWYTSKEAINSGLATTTGEATKEKPAKAAWFANAPANLFESSADCSSRKRAIAKYHLGAMVAKNI